MKNLWMILLMLTLAGAMLFLSSCGCDDDDDDSGDDDDDDNTGGEVVSNVIVDDPNLDPWQYGAGTVGDRPALVWLYADWDNEEYKLYYLRSLDAKGAQWPDQTESVLLPTGGERVGAPQLIQLADGTPMVIFSFGDNGYLAYMKAQDTAGSAWDAPVIIDDVNYSTGTLGGISVILIGDTPAVSYSAGSTDGLFYISAKNPAGDSWNDPVEIAQPYTDLDRICENRIAIVNGRPAVAYQHAEMTSNHYSVHYVRASDAKGGGWESPLLVDDSGNYCGASINLEFFDDAPLILHGNDSGDVILVQSADADGDSWNSPMAWPDFSGFHFRMTVFDPAEYDNGSMWVNVIASHYEYGGTKDGAEEIRQMSSTFMDEDVNGLEARLALALYGNKYGTLQLVGAITHDFLGSHPLMVLKKSFEHNMSGTWIAMRKQGNK